MDQVEPVRGVRDIADPRYRPIEEAKAEARETQGEEPHREAEEPRAPEKPALSMSRVRLPTPPDEIEADERRGEPDSHEARCPTQPGKDLVPVEQPAEDEEAEVRREDIRLRDEARRIIERPFLREAEDGKGDGGEDERAERRAHDRAKGAIDPGGESRQPSRERKSGQRDRVEDEEVFEEPQVHGVEMAKDFSGGVEPQVRAGDGRGVFQVHGRGRDGRDQGKQHRPPDGEREEDARRPVPEEACGAALLEEERGEEAGDAVEHGHPEDVDHAQGYVEQARRRAVLPGPVAVLGIGDRRVEIDPQEHHGAPEGVQRVVTDRGFRTHIAW